MAAELIEHENEVRDLNQFFGKVFKEATVLQHAATKNLFRIKHTCMDGNCMFDAVSICLEYLGRERLDHKDIRRQVVEYLRQHRYTQDGADRLNFLDITRYRSWEEYLKRMSNDGSNGSAAEWGDELCLRAMHELYQVIIKITDDTEQNDNQAEEAFDTVSKSIKSIKF